jgi:glycine cleavage system aminomethyltransferase T
VAYVDAELATPGAPLIVEVLGERRPAVVLAEPPFDPESRRPRS